MPFLDASIASFHIRFSGKTHSSQYAGNKSCSATILKCEQKTFERARKRGRRNREKLLFKFSVFETTFKCSINDA